MRYRVELNGRTFQEALDDFLINKYDVELPIIDLTKEYDEFNNGINNFIDNITIKGDYVICLEKPILNINKYRAKIESTSSVGRKKWYLKYAIYTYKDFKYLGRYSDKKKAIEEALAYTERTKISTEISAVKELSEGSPVLVKISYKYSFGEREGNWLFFNVI